jgi:hypothetical protein
VDAKVDFTLKRQEWWTLVWELRVKKKIETDSIQSHRRPAPRLGLLTLTSPAKPDAEPGGVCLSNANKLICGRLSLKIAYH